MSVFYRKRNTRAKEKTKTPDKHQTENTRQKHQTLGLRLNMYTYIFIWCFRLVFLSVVLSGVSFTVVECSLCNCRIYYLFVIAISAPTPYTSPLGLVPKLCCYCYAIPARAAHTRPPLRLCPTQGTLLSQRVTPFWHGFGPENVTFLKSSR